jgi:DHA2 family multidrug resistance protein-like MFS transporter
MVGISVFTTQYLESVLGLSPLAGALWSLAPTGLPVPAAAPRGSESAHRATVGG